MVSWVKRLIIYPYIIFRIIKLIGKILYVLPLIACLINGVLLIVTIIRQKLNPRIAVVGTIFLSQLEAKNSSAVI